VSGYTGYRERSSVAVRRREVPGGAIPLIISFGDRISVAAGDAPAGRTYTSFVAGLHDVHTFTEHSGRQHGIQINLTPLGAYRLLGLPMGELANQVVELDALRGRVVAELVERLAVAPSWPAAFDILDGVLAGWIADGPDVDPAVAWAWDQLTRSHGLVPVGLLADEIGWSRRHLVSRFRQQVGLPPKATGRVLRFRRAVELLGLPGSIADVAAECGYADHSHLVREFRSLAGCTPSELVASFNA
jgi:AraC-like DNA-binding protein